MENLHPGSLTNSTFTSCVFQDYFAIFSSHCTDLSTSNWDQRSIRHYRTANINLVDHLSSWPIASLPSQRKTQKILHACYSRFLPRYKLGMMHSSLFCLCQMLRLRSVHFFVSEAAFGAAFRPGTCLSSYGEREGLRQGAGPRRRRVAIRD